MDSNIVIHVVSDTQDAGILALTQIALVMASISTGISGLLLIDWFKRRGWQYKHRKKHDKEDKELERYLKKEKENEPNFEAL